MRSITTFDAPNRRRSGRPLLLVCLVSVLVPVTAGADRLEWSDVLGGLAGPNIWHAPNAEGTATQPGPKVSFSALSIYVDVPGIYEITSLQQGFETFDGMLFLYGPTFDPEAPLVHFIAGNDDGPGGVGTSRLEATLTPGVVYRIVTTFSGQPPGPFVRFTNAIEGPGSVRPSACFLGDEPELSDQGQDIALVGGRFCVYATWEGFDGVSGVGTVVGHRSESSGMLSFFDDGNWELLVKVLDGCAINGHYWVLLAATTNVRFELFVRDYELSDVPRVYTNPLGRPGDSILDTGAFDCVPFP